LLNITDRNKKKTDCEQNIYNAQVGYVHGTAVVLYFLVYYKKIKNISTKNKQINKKRIRMAIRIDE
jgi:hypothetical protein